MRVDVLILSTGRPDALAVTLTTLTAQTHRPFRVLVAEDGPDPACGPLLAVTRMLDLHGTPVEFVGRPPTRALDDQRRLLLARAEAPVVLFVDDDGLCEPDLLHGLVTALRDQQSEPVEALA